MNNQNPKNSIRQKVLEKIKNGEVRKVPRAYFVLRIVASIFVSLLLFVGSALVVSFIFFSLHESGEQFLLGFGIQGIVVFLKLFPWLILLFDLALVFLLEWLLQGFKFGYRLPLLNVFLGILVFSFIGGGLLDFTPLHDELLQLANQHDLPILAPAYEHIFDPHDDDGVCRGVVVSVGQSDFVIKHDDFDHDADDGDFTIGVPPGSNFPIPQVGQRVLVFGMPPPPDADQEKPGSSTTPYIEARDVHILPPLNQY